MASKKILLQASLNAPTVVDGGISSHEHRIAFYVLGRICLQKALQSAIEIFVSLQ
jgi:hypothetical protein